MTIDYAALRALAQKALVEQLDYSTYAANFGPARVLAMLDDLNQQRLDVVNAQYRRDVDASVKLYNLQQKHAETLADERAKHQQNLMDKDAETARLRGAIREAIAFLENDPPEVNVRDHINALRAALGDGGEGIT